MKVINIYKTAVVTLLVLNGILVFLFFSRPDHRRMPPGGDHPLKEKIIKRLNFDEDQAKAFHQFAQDHRDTMNKLKDDERVLIKSYFGMLKGNTDQNERQQIMVELQATEAKKIDVTYDHLADLKGLCDTKQVTEFPTLVDEITELLLGDDKKMPPPPRVF